MILAVYDNVGNHRKSLFDYWSALISFSCTSFDIGTSGSLTITASYNNQGTSLTHGEIQNCVEGR